MLPGTVRGVPSQPVTVRPCTRRDWWWLTKAGLAPELAGTQYHWAETPLQLGIAPTRGLPLRPGPRSVIEVDGRRAGYIGRSPLSGNLEYFLAPWARGGGVGTHAITQFLSHQRVGDQPRTFFVSHHNPRSRAALERAMATLGWSEGDGYTTTDGRFGWRITVHRDRGE